MAGVAIIQATHGAAEPCDRFGQGEPLAADGVPALLAYLEREGIGVTDVGEVTVGGRSATRFAITPPAACTEPYLGLFGSSPEVSSLPATAELTVFEADDGSVVVIAADRQSADAPSRAWEDSVIDGLRFDERP
jgi:hypothetical protein